MQNNRHHSLDMDMGMADRDNHNLGNRSHSLSYSPSFSPADIILVDSIVYDRMDSYVWGFAEFSKFILMTVQPPVDVLQLDKT